MSIYHIFFPEKFFQQRLWQRLGSGFKTLFGDIWMLVKSRQNLFLPFLLAVMVSCLVLAIDYSARQAGLLISIEEPVVSMIPLEAPMGRAIALGLLMLSVTPIALKLVFGGILVWWGLCFGAWMALDLNTPDGNINYLLVAAVAFGVSTLFPQTALMLCRAAGFILTGASS